MNELNKLGQTIDNLLVIKEYITRIMRSKDLVQKNLVLKEIYKEKWIPLT